MVSDPLVLVRSGLGAALRRAIAGDLQLDAGQLATPEDPGLFGPGSAMWRVHGDASMLIGGLRALLLQTLHPLAMAGVAEHSDYRQDPWGRLHRTGHFLGSTTFGTTATAEQAIEVVRRVHRRVRGTAPDGRPYAADDPHLMLWVHVTEADSFLRAHRRYGAERLRDAEADEYVAQIAEIARRLGAEDPPTDVRSLEASIERFRPELRAGPQARDAVRFLLAPPVPLVTRGVYGLIAGAAIGLLPSWARRELRLPMPPLVDPLLIGPSAQTVTRTMGWLLASQSRAARATASAVGSAEELAAVPSEQVATAPSGGQDAAMPGADLAGLPSDQVATAPSGPLAAVPGGDLAGPWGEGAGEARGTDAVDRDGPGVDAA